MDLVYQTKSSFICDTRPGNLKIGSCPNEHCLSMLEGGIFEASFFRWKGENPEYIWNQSVTEASTLLVHQVLFFHNMYRVMRVATVAGSPTPSPMPIPTPKAILSDSEYLLGDLE
jgi:hypothetical protein